MPILRVYIIYVVATCSVRSTLKEKTLYRPVKTSFGPSRVPVDCHIRTRWLATFSQSAWSLGRSRSQTAQSAGARRGFSVNCMQLAVGDDRRAFELSLEFWFSEKKDLGQ